MGDDGTSAWPGGTTGPASGGNATTSDEGAQAPAEPSVEPDAEAQPPDEEPTDLTHGVAAERVTARVMVSGLWANQAGTKRLMRDDLVVVAHDDRRVGPGKPLALEEGGAADPDVASKLAALAEI